MKPNATERPVRVGLISLGCAKNLVDAEIMLGTLLKEGVEITNDASQADVVIVNTCSFIDSAQEESVDTILESAEVRETQNRDQGLVVSGCLPQRFREELPRLLPEVDAFMGIDQVTQVTAIVKQALARRQDKRLAAAERGRPSPAPKRRSRIVGRLAQLAPAHARPPERDTEPSSRSGFEPPATLASARQARPMNPDLRGSIPHQVSSSAPVLTVNPRPHYIPDFATPRFRLTPRHFAYLKIAEGCNHPCSFCLIPRMRGTHRSRPPADILAEAKALLADGVKELNLISQDSTYYGLDLRPNHSRAISSPARFGMAVRGLPAEAASICSLLHELNALPGDFWIRLLYTHPAHWTDELIRTIAACSKVARYVDIPLQHIHENMLERMRRETSQQYILDLLQRIRAGIPGIALRTTFIVGFPGETETYFQALLDFIRATKFERLGVFAYSREEQTRAGNMAGQLTDRVKRRRRDLAMAAQHEVAVQVSESFVGRTLKVLVEKAANANELRRARVQSWEHGLMRANPENGPGEAPATPRRRAKNGLPPAGSRGGETGSAVPGSILIARGEADAPEIDGRVYVRGRPLPLGEFARVKVVGHTDYDLMAEPAT